MIVRQLNQSESEIKVKNIKKIVLIIIALLIAVLGYFYLQNDQSKNQVSQSMAQNQLRGLLNDVDKLIKLPVNEDPLAYEIKEVENFEGKTFFQSAKNDDVLIIYAGSGQAILYRPSSKEVINSAPVEIGANYADINLVASEANQITASGINQPAIVAQAGEKGDKGDKGDKGAKGDKGDKGDTVVQGIQGEKGEKGDKGDIGPIGLTGLQGPIGLTGPKGDTGSQGLPGEKGDKGDKGDAGIQGEKGEIGLTGLQGPIGPIGLTGPQGSPGDKGDKGDTGAQGIQGLKGDKGDTGDIGPIGPIGLTGPQGLKGDKGDTV